MSKRVRLTSFGLIVIITGVILLLLMALTIVKIVSCSANKQADIPVSSDAPEPSDEPEPTPDVPPDDGFYDAGTVTDDGTGDATATFSPDWAEATPVPTPTPEPEKDKLAPTEEELANALPGKMTNGGVVLRAAPDKNGDILGKYGAGTLLSIFGSGSDDYYFVQIKNDGKCGYMAKKFITVVTATPTPTPTPEPVPVPEGAVGGKVIKSKVALRSEPDLTNDKNKIGQLLQNDPVFIYFQTGDFYYIEVPSTGTKAYAYCTYIKPDGAVPVQ